MQPLHQLSKPGSRQCAPPSLFCSWQQATDSSAWHWQSSGCSHRHLVVTMTAAAAGCAQQAHFCGGRSRGQRLSSSPSSSDCRLFRRGQLSSSHGLGICAGARGHLAGPQGWDWQQQLMGLPTKRCVLGALATRTVHDPTLITSPRAAHGHPPARPLAYRFST